MHNHSPMLPLQGTCPQVTPDVTWSRHCLNTHACCPCRAVTPKDMEHRLGTAAFNRLKGLVLQHQETVLEQTFALHRVVALQRHLVAVCKQPELLAQETARLEAAKLSSATLQSSRWVIGQLWPKQTGRHYCTWSKRSQPVLLAQATASWSLRSRKPCRAQGELQGDVAASGRAVQAGRVFRLHCYVRPGFNTAGSGHRQSNQSPGRV